MAADRVNFAILEHLAHLKEKAVNEEQTAQFTAAIECLEGAFNLSLGDLDQKKKFSLYPKSLTDILSSQTTPEDEDFQRKFEIYIDKLKERKYFEVGPEEAKNRFEKAKVKFKENYDGMKAKKASEKAGPTEQEKEAANQLKNKGNSLLTQGNYQDAIKAYSDAIALNPLESIFYCNRAAAYTHIQQNEKALEDCRKAVELDPNYAKAYSRMGLAYFNLNNFQESVKSYKKALELDPANVQFQQALESAEQKVRESSSPQGMPDLSALLSDPAISSMAQSFAQNMMNRNAGGAPAAAGGPPPPMPDLSQLMQDPALQGMLGGNAAAGGAPPNLANLLNNPNVMQMAQQAMQNPAIQNMIGNLMQNPDTLNSLLSNFGSQMGSLGVPPPSSQPPAEESAPSQPSEEMEVDKANE